MIIAAWCRELKQNLSMVRGRIYRGWNELEALLAPKDSKRDSFYCSLI